MIRPANLRPLLFCALLAGAALAALGVRLYVVQIVRHERYKDIVEDNTHRTVLKPSRRGDLLDAEGLVLATSVPVKRVVADPSLIYPHQAAVARAVAPLLSMSEAEMVHALRPLRTNDAGLVVTNRYVDFKRKLTFEQWQQVTQAMRTVDFGFNESLLTKKEKRHFEALRSTGIRGVDDYQRVYPGTRLASHVLGYVQEVERFYTNSAARASTMETRGIYGIEHWLDSKLRGITGWRVTQTDSHRRELVAFRHQDVDARAGLTARLTIDSFIQQVVEEQLAEAMKKFRPNGARAVVVRPRTGEILALASLPDFDPNQPGRAGDNERRNRVIADVNEPGSTFKIVVVSAGLNEQTITLEEMFDCENGRWHFKGKPLHDHDGGFPSLSVEGIITKSSNIGSAKIAVYRLGEEKLHDYIKRFGFGDRTGITLDGEVAGIFRHWKKWDGVAVSRIPMGQSIASTPLQMVMAMSAIANEGRLMRPMLIDSLVGADGEVFARFQPQVVRQVIDPRAARQMVKALKTVPTKKGTAEKAEMEHYTVAGKTGTAQVSGGKAGYLHGKYVSSFIGFFPADEPEVCISVVIDQPDTKKGYYGGQTAAPYFKVIAEQVANYLKIKPDRNDSLGETLVGGTNSIPGAVASRRLQP